MGQRFLNGVFYFADSSRSLVFPSIEALFFFICFGGVLEIDNQPSEWLVSSIYGSEPFFGERKRENPRSVSVLIPVLQRVSRMLVGSLFGHRVSS